ncbi:hypothetical protein LY01_02148 [Nonlabens xylanidelens]|uniref:Uncharacterized protein n=1 Tax=Nonlabens xylanidelens TaxID=191564 RepID=A0A2S6IIB9_9FLAO|nr:hypothetical protein [Nonlabens xylanidelens]PPK93926.1 hypothetical protein LY01_02148 [Nonlabens xylanidelens]PQJ22082.1 hypothetical protein BST94_00455 [Nonlabens xylanidelens]
MSSSEQIIVIPKIYKVFGVIALFYSAILIVMAIYNQFFYVDGTWFHGFTANGFAVFSSFLWIIIMFFFKRFLNNVINYKKANLLINFYMIFLVIPAILMGIVMYKSVNLYFSLQDPVGFNTLSAFAISSFLSIALIFISNGINILFCILLGNNFRKIDVVEQTLFRILGFVFIVYGIVEFLIMFVIENDTLHFILRAILAILVGLIIRKIYGMDYTKLNLQLESKKVYKADKLKQKIKITELPSAQKENDVKSFTQSNKTYEAEKKEQMIFEIAPIVNLDEIENKEQVFSYYEKLSDSELKRLRIIIESKYGKNLSEDQKADLIKHYIGMEKLYDHQRFLPK